MNIDFNKGDGLVPAIIQDAQTMQVLMLGYMNREAFDKTRESGNVTFFSRSKNRLWMKGESSGNTLTLVDLKLDCDKDTLLIYAIPKGPTCHTGSTSCFKDETAKGFVYQLEKTINDRIDSNDPNSYTNELYQQGINKVAQKVGEEAVELVIEAKDSNDDLFKNEAADLIYHFLILLKKKNMSFTQIEKVLKSRS
ncbi:MAG TPA: bifunctional phosphoribosyl-AMP cyclohydrolase/phosphoribosyl-ATP diphosphatase [Flavobacteriales bacterium]|nr:bifunctional phosphoribosyl-AMP cyclohydrolase/phosphoribosyl-ATP diphosphatase [Crocinitomicaceae bacterium]HAE29764.1 bifunctional phosphoribosyl-AMP cyclohydrolase/phosphoribosyl-ATP diphosphatase [Flavobacteriales bacterium]|tara:strand:- start:63 stop:647 length:585 start_codon:yes stop_codon:yes gene_type:complete